MNFDASIREPNQRYVQTMKYWVTVHTFDSWRRTRPAYTPFAASQWLNREALVYTVLSPGLSREFGQSGGLKAVPTRPPNGKHASALPSHPVLYHLPTAWPVVGISGGGDGALYLESLPWAREEVRLAVETRPRAASLSATRGGASRSSFPATSTGSWLAATPSVWRRSAGELERGMGQAKRRLEFLLAMLREVYDAAHRGDLLCRNSARWWCSSACSHCACAVDWKRPARASKDSRFCSHGLAPSYSVGSKRSSDVWANQGMHPSAGPNLVIGFLWLYY
jgi:hypothetical protein